MSGPNVERKNLDRSALKATTIVWVVGGPGSGKGTQCEMAQIKFAPGLHHVSSGEVLRAEVMSGSNRGGQIYKLMANGEKVPNAIVDDLMAERMLDLVGRKGAKFFLIDGFPLDLSQAEAFVADIGEPAAIVALEAGNEVLKQRLKSRANFDDTDASIEKRLAIFTEQTTPVLDKFGGKVRRLNAERNKDEVFADLHTLLQQLQQ